MKTMTLANVLAMLGLTIRTHKNEDGTLNDARRSVRLPPGQTSEMLFTMLMLTFKVSESIMTVGYTYLWLSFPSSALENSVMMLPSGESANKVAGIETPASKPTALAPVLWDDADQPDPLKN